MIALPISQGLFMTSVLTPYEILDSRKRAGFARTTGPATTSNDRYDREKSHMIDSPVFELLPTSTSSDCWIFSLVSMSPWLGMKHNTTKHVTNLTTSMQTTAVEAAYMGPCWVRLYLMNNIKKVFCSTSVARASSGIPIRGTHHHPRLGTFMG